MSRTSSMPTDRRIMSSVTPLAVLLGHRQLLVRRRGRMDHERLGVADVGQQREELQRVDERLRGAALERTSRSRPRRSGRYSWAPAAGWPGGPDTTPRHLRGCARNSATASAFSNAAQGAAPASRGLQEQPRVEWRECGADVAQQLHARLDDVGDVPEGGGVLDTVVRRIRLHEVGEAGPCPSRSCRRRRWRRRWTCRGRR